MSVSNQVALILILLLFLLLLLLLLFLLLLLLLLFFCSYSCSWTGSYSCSQSSSCRSCYQTVALAGKPKATRPTNQFQLQKLKSSEGKTNRHKSFKLPSIARPAIIDLSPNTGQKLGRFFPLLSPTHQSAVTAHNKRLERIENQSKGKLTSTS